MDEHDSNITFTDGIKVKYYKSERDKQIKHHGYNHPLEWTYVLKRWNIEPKDIDAIGIVLDAYLHPWNEFIKETDRNCEIDVPFFRDLGFTCPIYRVDHHYAHHLSSWVFDTEYDKTFVFDGYGDDFVRARQGNGPGGLHALHRGAIDRRHGVLQGRQALGGRATDAVDVFLDGKGHAMERPLGFGAIRGISGGQRRIGQHGGDGANLAIDRLNAIQVGRNHLSAAHCLAANHFGQRRGALGP